MRKYLCIDLKSFYASVECLERGMDPMKTNLVVADPGRTEKTICLAVTPSLKKYGISGRARLFEVVQKIQDINKQRKKRNGNVSFSGESFMSDELEKDYSLEMSYIVAPPRMSHYMKYSTNIYNVYLKYVSFEDIHVYSVDEVFIDITKYLESAKMSAYDFSMMIIRDVYKTSGITATAGIGTNMYLAKIAMDIMAKKMKADSDGVRIAELDEMTYRMELWDHRPLSDFWRVGKGISDKLKKNGIYTMGDIARESLSESGETKLYKLFGVNAELLIDHAWGWEPCTIDDIKKYNPENKSTSMGQVLHEPYTFEKARIIIREMLELLSLDLVEKNLVTDQIVLTVGYDIENLTNPKIRNIYKGEITKDHYGRKVPKSAHGTVNLECYTASTMIIADKVMKLYDEIVDGNLLVRRMNVSANHIINESSIKKETRFEQIDIFSDSDMIKKEETEHKEELKKERAIQKATIELRNKFGKNAVLKGINLKEGATTIDRNKQIGGHKA